MGGAVMTNPQTPATAPPDLAGCPEFDETVSFDPETGERRGDSWEPPLPVIQGSVLSADREGLMEVAAAWMNRANELTTWVVQRLGNRGDIWGCYEENRQGIIAGKTAPKIKERIRRKLCINDILNHFQATDHRFVIGLHSGSPGPHSTAIAVAGDLDQHDDDETCSEVNLEAAL